MGLEVGVVWGRGSKEPYLLPRKARQKATVSMVREGLAGKETLNKDRVMKLFGKDYLISEADGIDRAPR